MNWHNISAKGRKDEELPIPSKPFFVPGKKNGKPQHSLRGNPAKMPKESLPVLENTV